jgi:hypothetical protein
MNVRNHFQKLQKKLMPTLSSSYSSSSPSVPLHSTKEQWFGSRPGSEAAVKSKGVGDGCDGWEITLETANWAKEGEQVQPLQGN